MDTMVSYFIHAGLCSSEEDFKIVSPDVCIVNKTAYLSDSDLQDTNYACSTAPNKQFERTNLSLFGCRNWCDDSAISAISWCSNYPTLCMINACNSAVIEIQSYCRSCCQNGFSQDLCAAPFGDIVAVMQKYLPPCGGCRALVVDTEAHKEVK